MAPTGVRRGFATLVPAAEDPLINVITVDHHKHAGRAPAGHGLVSLIASPGGTTELLGAPDPEVTERLTARAERFMPGVTAHTLSAHVHRFRHGLPEATPRAVALRAAFEARPVSAIEYAGDWTTLRPCSEGAITSAERAAARVLAHLARPR
ncbi:FAD-dependent oxidoreductase [Microtetraspora malaysiensis]|uniref:FAD-dependent oxidoreductase n=1 Tax=Microtetraspora malaysiensis TaxID=161358 RepID=UPI003D8E5F7E